MDRRRLIPIFIIVFVNFLGATLVLPTIQLFARRQLNAPPEVITLIGASYFAAQFLAGPVLGRLSDRHGRIPVLIFSQIGTVISFVMMALSQNIAMLFAARILDGITGGNVIVAQAYITDITPPEQRTRALGLVFAAFGLGYIIGPGIGGFLMGYGDHVPFIAGALVSLMTVILTTLTLKESLSAEERLRRRQQGHRLTTSDVLGNSSLLLVLGIAFTAQLALSFLRETFALYGETVIFRGYAEKDISLGVGLLLTAVGIGQVVTQLLLIKPLVSRLGERKLVMLGGALRAFGMLSVVAFTSPWLIGGVALAAFAVGSGLMMPSLQSLATTSVDDEMRGGVLGVYNSFTSLGVIIGSVISGTLFATSPMLPYLLGGIILAGTVVPAYVLSRRNTAVRPT